MRWARHVAQRERRGKHVSYWWERQKDRDQSEDQEASGWIILVRIFERYNVVM
jgi:hypothetical protein